MNAVSLPPWLQTLAWACSPLRALDHWAKRLGDVFTMRFVGGRTFVVVSHPAAVEQVFTRFPEVANDELRPFLGERSLFTLNGPDHAAHRHLLQPYFRPEAVRRHADRARQLTFDVVSRLRPGDTAKVVDLARGIALSNISSVVFGSEAPRDRALRCTLLDMADVLSGPTVFFECLQRDLGPGSPGRALRSTMRRGEAAIREQAGRSGTSDGALGRLVEAREAGAIGQQDVLDETKALVGAGMDPVAGALAWALYWTHRDRRVLERLRSEVGALDPQSFDAVAVGTESGSYLDQVCRETLRIIPVIPATDRLVTEPCEFLGHHLKPGVRVVACAYLTHRRAEIYREPSEFRPQRFAERRYSSYEYYPFGGGNRRCLGAYYASIQLKVALATILSSVSFRVCSQRAGLDQKGVLLTPSGRLRLEVERAAS